MFLFLIRQMLKFEFSDKKNSVCRAAIIETEVLENICISITHALALSGVGVSTVNVLSKLKFLLKLRLSYRIAFTSSFSNSLTQIFLNLNFWTGLKALMTMKHAIASCLVE